MLRESTHYPGDYTLCVKSDVRIENYRIKRVKLNFQAYTIDDEITFRNLIKLVEVIIFSILFFFNFK